MTKRGRSPLPQKAVYSVIRAYAKGTLTIKGAAVALGISQEDTRTLLDLFGVDHRPKGRRSKADDDEF